MNDESHNQMDLARFQELVDTHGGDADYWPEAQREQALQFINSSPDAVRIQQQAIHLDMLLQQVDAIEPSTALRRAVAEIPVRHPQDVYWPRLLPFGSLWKSITAAVLAGALGIALGIVSLDPQTGDAANNNWDDYYDLAFATELDQEILP